MDVGACPLYDVGLDGSVANGQVQVRSHPDDAWTNVSLPYAPTPDQNTVGMQARVVSLLPADGNMSNFTAWNVEALEMDMFGGQHPARPRWISTSTSGTSGAVKTHVGTWGWQDRFANAEERMELALTSGAPTVGKVWVPSRI